MLPWIALFPLLALGAPTIEEQALTELLRGRPAVAVRLLESGSSRDPSLRQVAGLVALRSGALDDARRLLEADPATVSWGRIEVLHAEAQLDKRGRSASEAEAAHLALLAMDEAMGTAHADELARQLLSWARERSVKDPANASRLLVAALEFQTSDELGSALEDELFTLLTEPSPETIAAARRRLLASPGDPGALRIWGVALCASNPKGAFEALMPTLRAAPLELAFDAARRLSKTAIPSPWAIEAENELLRRFPEDERVGRWVLDQATLHVKADAALADEAFGGLFAIPKLAARARLAFALGSPEARERRRLLLALASTEGASSLGNQARQAALEALRQGVTREQDPEKRRALARAALQEPDGALDPQIHFAALPGKPIVPDTSRPAQAPADPGGERLEALWVLATRFPNDKTVCAELATRLLWEGANHEVSLRFSTLCTTDLQEPVRVLRAHAREADALVLSPARGALDVISTGRGRIQVSQHTVDPEVLFRTTEGHPLGEVPNAWLLDADLEWEIAPPADGSSKASISSLRPRGPAPLVALTLRDGKERATALVVRDPLEVQAIRQGRALFVAVLREGRPVSGARLLVQDGEGAFHEARTRGDGLASMMDLPGSTRIFARTEGAIGFATVLGGGSAPEEAPPQISLHLPERYLPSRADRGRIFVFATRPAGDAEARVLLRSFSAEGRPMDEATLDLAGVGEGSLWMEAGGRVTASLAGSETVLAQRTLPAAPPAMERLRLVVSDPSPQPGEKLRLRYEPLTPPKAEGWETRVRIETPWDELERSFRLGVDPTPAELQSLDLSVANPGDRILVSVTLAGEPTYRTELVVSRPRVPAPVLGTLVRSLGPCEDWLLATQGDRSLWLSPGATLALPGDGTWLVKAWREGLFSAGTELRVPAGPLAEDGTWEGPPALVVTSTGARVLRRGMPFPIEPPPAGAPHHNESAAWHDAWGHAFDLRVHAREAPVLRIEGALRSKAPSEIILGGELPAGTRLWAFLRDASDLESSAPLDPIQTRSVAPNSFVHALWRPREVVAETMAAALLAEEERLAERAEPQLVDFDFSPAGEISAVGGEPIILGAKGRGRGAGGTADGLGGLGTRGRASSEVTVKASIDGRSLGILRDGAPGAWTVEIPPWVSAVEVDLIARLPDGRWTRAREMLPVEGVPSGRPSPKAEETPEEDPSFLLQLARSLPEGPAIVALQGLVAAGHEEARPALEAIGEVEPEHLSLAVAMGLASERRPKPARAQSRLEGLSNSRSFERAMAALGASGAPERALAAARRLLREGPAAIEESADEAHEQAGALLDPLLVSRAALAIWAAGERQEALGVLESASKSRASSSDLDLRLAKALIEGQSEASLLPVARALARNEAADPLERAIALAVLARAEPMERAELVASPPRPCPALNPIAEPPLATRGGSLFSRGWSITEDPDEHSRWDNARLTGMPAGRVFPLRVVLPPQGLPTRVQCPEGSLERYLSLPPHYRPQELECRVQLPEALVGQRASLAVAWFDPQGEALGRGEVSLLVEPWRTSTATDPMSPDERLTWAESAAREGDPGATRLLRELLSEPSLSEQGVRRASVALLGAATRGDSAEALVAAFESYRERVPDGLFPLSTAASVARSYEALGEHTRALEATRVVMDARFREELSAVNAHQEGGLPFTALKLLKELLRRYPELPTVVDARYLSPSMLLAEASSRKAEAGDQARMGYTRSSLRHTAVAELSRFLLLHPADPRAVEAAGLLLDTLAALDDPDRSVALAGALSQGWQDQAGSWRLGLSDASARIASGDLRGALTILDRLERSAQLPSEQRPWIKLEQGRALEALGRRDDSLKAYKTSAVPEAMARVRALERDSLELPSFLVQEKGEPPLLETDLPQGVEAELVAYGIHLESLLLAEGGHLDISRVRVDGLRVSRRQRARTLAGGGLPLPELAPGAWLLAVSVPSGTRRVLLLRTDERLSARSGPSGGTLIQLESGGRPVAQAQLWLFGKDGVVSASRTDPLGTVWLEGGASELGILAKDGDHYAWWGPTGREGLGGDWQSVATPGPDEDAGVLKPEQKRSMELLRSNESAYKDLFRHDRRAQIRADEL